MTLRAVAAVKITYTKAFMTTNAKSMESPHTILQ